MKNEKLKMKNFTKQLLFLLIAGAVITSGALIIKGATPSGGLKVNPILGHDLDLDAKYYGYAANNGVHQITTEDISISAWVKVDVDAGQYNEIFSKQTTNNFYRFYYSNGKLTAYIKDGTTADAMYISTSAIKDNKWHHIAFVIDKDTNANSKIYIDGSSVTLTAAFTLTVGSLTNTGTVALGSSSQTPGAFLFDGQIRDVKLYYAAGDHWSDAQVLYQAQHPFDYTAGAGTLTDYWRLDEGSGTTLYGKPTTGNNLTLSNVLAWTTQPKIKMVNQENATTTSNNPVGWWKMDEGTGQYAYDVSGNGNTGTLGTSTSAEPADPTWTTGKLGKGLSFDGSNDYVSLTGLVATGGTYTITLWGKFTDIGGNQYIFDSQTDRLIIAILLDGVSNFRFYDGTTKDYGAGISNVSYLNVWHYYTFVFNAGNTTAYLYIDGSLKGSNATYSSKNIGGAVALMARYDNTGSANINGLIDDVRIYNRALSAGEVAQQYNSTKDGYLGKIKVSTGLVGYWKLDDNNALTSVIDYSGKGNTGTAYSGTATSTSVLSTSTAMVGRAMSFDGVDDYLSMGDPNSLDLNAQNFTVGGWFYKTGVPRGGITKATWNTALDTGNGYSLIISHDRTFIFKVSSGTGQTRRVDSAAYSLNTWYYAVGVWNYSTQTATLYVNGVLIASNTYSAGTVGPIINTTEPFLIGPLSSTYSDPNDNIYNGLIDEVKIWNYARSAEQIKNDYIRNSKGLK